MANDDEAAFRRAPSVCNHRLDMKMTSKHDW